MNAIKNFNPDCLVLEGFDNGPVTLKAQELRDKHLGHSEIGYALRWAKEKKVPFVGGDPECAAVKAAILNSGYQSCDYEYFQFLQCIPQFVRQGTIYGTVDAYLAEYFKEFCDTTIDPKVGVHNFNAWYKHRMGAAPDLKLLKAATFTLPLKNGSWIQQLSYKISHIRDQTILNRIVACTKDHDRVLVIYGALHYFQQYQALEKLFDQPVYQKKTMREGANDLFGGVWTYYYSWWMETVSKIFS